MSTNNLLYPFHSVCGRIDYLNKQMLDRLRDGTSRLAASVRAARQRRWGAPLLLFILIIYLFMGATCFYVFEHAQHDRGATRWETARGVNRRHFARLISSRIFNDTRNLLIIIDREQTDRVQKLLTQSLEAYEKRLDVKIPDKKEWAFANSFNYAYGLLLTLGHGAKTPQTIAGQVFALAYSLIGIPLFYITLIYGVYVTLDPFLQSTAKTVRRRLFVFYMTVILYVIWTLLMALFLYYQVFNSFWTSVFVSFLSGLTVQVPEYASLSQCCLLILLLACTISAIITIMLILLLLSVCCGSTTEVSSPSKKTPLLETSENTSGQKFTIIVDEAGSSKLAA